MNNFWRKLNKNFLALAPLAGITNMPFRLICQDFGADVVYSEMASAAALSYQPKKTLELVRSDNRENNLVIQLFGSEPKHFAIASQRISDEKFALSLDIINYHKPAGIDINLGCPASKVLNTGSGAGLFQNVKVAKDCIKAVIDNTDLPVSIKIRKSAGAIQAIDFLKEMEDLPIQAVMVHGRSLKEGFMGEIDFEAIQTIKNYFNGVVIANGGIVDKNSYKEIIAKTNVVGVGLARGILGKPWLFKMLKDDNFKIDRDLIFETILKHAQLVAADNAWFIEFRKHLAWYVGGLPRAKEMRMAAVKINNYEDVLKFVHDYQFML